MLIDTWGRNLFSSKEEFPSCAENSMLVITVVYIEITSYKMGTGSFFSGVRGTRRCNRAFRVPHCGVFSPSGVPSYSTKGTSFGFLRAVGFSQAVLSCILARLEGGWDASYPSIALIWLFSERWFLLYPSNGVNVDCPEWRSML